ncbi:hypothetical protein FEDK69T_18090 [Flavobacterium enshiense DK69]|uniref:Uncharacterized protein n=1 Tax=Flavobacterium enshiense DK69 TaxID=1107311 RepID=V6S8Y4_9FLAO|nr:hypothetical protein [Flavobacterium enshiense]ESU22904.1 hypothetical protein FEDK69T_18090 [Flavobacterium enshiense DK69]KGO94035.1 hypothetical protein Q767_13970 [Flavobacterium enshiense DK69]
MSSTNETGHAKNIANFQSLIQFVVGYGAAYNPSKNTLKIPQLNTIATNSNTKLADVITKNTAFNNAVNDRINSFNGLKTLSTRLVNALETTNASKEKIKDAKGFNRKMHGKRVSAIQTPTDPNAPAPKTISASQLSFDQQIQHFAGLVAILQSEVSFTPNEVELKLTALTAKQVDLVAKNNAVATAYTAISNSRIARDKTLYDDGTGLVETALEVKKYVKSLFGPSSPEFAQVQGIEFRKIKK